MKKCTSLKSILLAAACIALSCNTSGVSAQIISTIAGNGTAGFGGDGGPATAAMLNSNWGMAVDAHGNVFVSDFANNRIRKIDTSGIISTYAGSGSSGFSGDGGPATSARISGPTGLGVDGAGNVYISDISNNRIRKISTSGIITTVAGGGSSMANGIPATNAQLHGANGLAVDNAGNIYIPDQTYQLVRKVNTSGIINTVAGNGTTGSTGDGGPATNASINCANDVSVDATGNLYISDWYSNKIRFVNTSGIITTYAGNGTAGFSGDGGAATAAMFTGPMGVDFDASRSVVICDVDNHRVRHVDAAGIITTIAGTGTAGYSGDGGQATAAKLSRPVKVAFDATGNMYISDRNNNRIRKVAGCNPTVGVAISVSPSDSITAGTTDTFTAVVTNGGATITYQWQRNGVNIPGATMANYITDSLHNHDSITCRATGNPCSATNTGTSNAIGLTVRTGLGLQQLIGIGSGISAYPNPNKGRFTLQLASPMKEDAYITITNILGERVKELTISTNTTTEIALQLPQGIYFVAAQTNTARYTTKIVITN